MPKYTTKPSSFDAVPIPAAGAEFDDSVADLTWVLDAALSGAIRRTDTGISLTLPDQGLLNGAPGDWLMRASDGSLTITPAATFEAHYEVAPAGGGSTT